MTDVLEFPDRDSEEMLKEAELAYGPKPAHREFVEWLHECQVAEDRRRLQDDRVRRDIERVRNHKRMRAKGMSKHTAGNAKAMGLRSEIPGAVLAGDGLTLDQWRKARKAKAKKKRKLSKQGRRNARRGR